jgi:hypothetical protein
MEKCKDFSILAAPSAEKPCVFWRDPIAGRSLHKFEGMDSEKLFNSEHSDGERFGISHRYWIFSISPGASPVFLFSWLF